MDSRQGEIEMDSLHQKVKQRLTIHFTPDVDVKPVELDPNATEDIALVLDNTLVEVMQHEAEGLVRQLVNLNDRVEAYLNTAVPSQSVR